MGNLIPVVAGFVLGSAATAAFSYLVAESRRRRDENEGSGYSHDRSAPCLEANAPVPTSKSLPPAIRSEQLSRNHLYFGQEGLSAITHSNVCVVGLGGVGSHCAHLLARSGVKYLRLVDFDQVTVSSLNRHACATLEDVGMPKVTVLKKFLEKVCPDTTYLEVDARVQMYTGEERDGDLLDGKKWDVIIDAIDDVPTKARLLAHCVRHGIRCISCQGAGGKSDFTRLHVSDLRSASRDPLASKLRQTMKRICKNDETIKDDSFLDDPDKISVVYSSEKTVVKLADFTEEQKDEGVHKFGAVDNMRIRVLPVLGTMPAIMGQSCAALALCEIGEKPFSPVAGERVGRNVRHRLFQHLKRREKRIRDSIEAESPDSQISGSVLPSGVDQREGRVIKGKWVGPVQIDGDDVEYLLAEVWRNRCAITGDRLGTVFELCRWDMTRKSDCTNLVLMGVRTIEKFDIDTKNIGDGRDGIPPEVRSRIEKRLATCKVDIHS